MIDSSSAKGTDETSTIGERLDGRGRRSGDGGSGLDWMFRFGGRMNVRGSQTVLDESCTSRLASEPARVCTACP